MKSEYAHLGDACLETCIRDDSLQVTFAGETRTQRSDPETTETDTALLFSSNSIKVGRKVPCRAVYTARAQGHHHILFDELPQTSIASKTRQWVKLGQ